MKRLFLTVVLAAAGWCAYAQNYMIVDSEKIFKSIDAYNTAIKDLDKMAEDYQKQVDDKFAEIETLYNNYQQQKASLSATTRQVLEDTILSKEKDATALQESLFGKDGTLMKTATAKVTMVAMELETTYSAGNGLADGGYKNDVNIPFTAKGTSGEKNIYYLSLIHI